LAHSGKKETRRNITHTQNQEVCKSAFKDVEKYGKGKFSNEQHFLIGNKRRFVYALRCISLGRQLPQLSEDKEGKYQTDHPVDNSDVWCFARYQSILHSKILGS
jgi:hypothetical protein